LIIAGKALLEGTNVKLAYGRKYGLVGRNGIGKTCLMNALARG
jgi:ATP-binding cassette subfamily F protein 3